MFLFNGEQGPKTTRWRFFIDNSLFKEPLHWDKSCLIRLLPPPNIWYRSWPITQGCFRLRWKRKFKTISNLRNLSFGYTKFLKENRIYKDPILKSAIDFLWFSNPGNLCLTLNEKDTGYDVLIFSGLDCVNIGRLFIEELLISPLLPLLIWSFGRAGLGVTRYTLSSIIVERKIL